MKQNLLLFLLLFSLISYAQQPRIVQVNQDNPVNHPPVSKSFRTLSTEICDNGIDDDGNGLTDREDYACYFSGEQDDLACSPTQIVWVVSNFGLHWVNLKTGVEKFVGQMPTMDDVAWTPGGKLYGISRITSELMEIDPLTAKVQPVYNFSNDRLASNAMTADAAGNLYLAAFGADRSWSIIRINPQTLKTEHLINLSSHRLESGGDLAFLNGHLYLTCTNSQLAKINLTTKSVEVSKIINTPNTAPFGLTNLGDGFLYFVSINELWRLDPATMVATFYHRLQHSDIYSLGLCSYTEQCHAPACKPQVSISIASGAPYCADPGVLLVAKGTGIQTGRTYTWRLPNGQSKNGDSLVATVSGKYYVRYHTSPDTCGKEDSVTLSIVSPPHAYLGNDTIVCAGNETVLRPLQSNGIDAYLWNDNSVMPLLRVDKEGTYSLKVSNACGVSFDTIIVREARPPGVRLGADTLLCPGTTITLHNQEPKQPWDTYLWSTAKTLEQETLDKDGLYWLEAYNACGTTRDSVLVTMNDSCRCQPFYAAADLGADQEMCLYDSVTLKNSLHQEGFRYNWSTGSEQKSIVIGQPGVYFVDVATYCGTVRDTIIVNKKEIGCTCDLYIPSAFTPNGDGRNDFFTLSSTCALEKFSLQVYNRWGEIVYATREPSGRWDGKYKGNSQPTGVYVYHITYQYRNRPGTFSKKGTITLIQ